MEPDELERALHEAEEKYRHIFENATEGIFQASTTGRITSANPALARLHGYDSPQELVDAVGTIRDQLFINPARHSELIRILLERDVVSNFEASMKRKDGSEHWISLNVRAFRNDEGRIIFYEGTMVDITERKQGEQALIESETRFRTVIENSNDGIALTRGGRLEYVNPRFVAMFGYDSPEDLVNRPIALHVHPDDRERVVEIHNRRRRGLPIPPRYEYRGITRAGEIIYIDVSAAWVTYQEEPAFVLFLRDISKRKRAEEVFLETHRQLEQLNRAKTKAISHISHELKTPLAVTQGYVRILKRTLEPESLVYEKVGKMLSSMERNLERLFLIQQEADEILICSRELEVRGLVDELDTLRERMKDLYEVPAEIEEIWDNLSKWMKAHVSRQSHSFQVVDLSQFVEQSVAKAQRHMANRQIDIEVVGKPGVSIMMEPTALRQIIDGLIRNAIENTPDRGSVIVKIETNDEEILFSVIDYGIGIIEDDQKYIFDGLFHTKEIVRYASRKPYDFDAGGKGLDLLRMKNYAGLYGFSLSVRSTRCSHLPDEGDVCPGDISRCPFCETIDDCRGSGSSTFTVTFRKNNEKSLATTPEPALPAPA
jgi:PAS domain S-box-containing protein